ncbi:MAG: redoxin domain-containing protein, partial [bacterium]
MKIRVSGARTKLVIGVIAAVLIMVSVEARSQFMMEQAVGLIPGQAVGSLKVAVDGGGQIDLGRPAKPYVLVFFVAGRDDIAAQFAEAAKILKSKELSGFDLIAITRGKDNAERKSARDFLKSKKIAASLVFDVKLEAAKKFGVMVFPTFFIVDKNGTVRTLAISSVKSRIRMRSFEGFLKMTAKGEPIPYIDMVPWSDIDKNVRALMGKP